MDMSSEMFSYDYDGMSSEQPASSSSSMTTTRSPASKSSEANTRPQQAIRNPTTTPGRGGGSVVKNTSVRMVHMDAVVVLPDDFDINKRF